MKSTSKIVTGSNMRMTSFKYEENFEYEDNLKNENYLKLSKPN